MTWYIIAWVLSILLTDIIIRIEAIEKKWVKQVLPHTICFIFFVVPWLFGVGIFKGNFLWLLALSFSGGLSANGLFTYSFIQKGLDWLLHFIPKKKIV